MSAKAKKTRKQIRNEDMLVRCMIFMAGLAMIAPVISYDGSGTQADLALWLALFGFPIGGAAILLATADLFNSTVIKREWF